MSASPDSSRASNGRESSGMASTLRRGPASATRRINAGKKTTMPTSLTRIRKVRVAVAGSNAGLEMRRSSAEASSVCSAPSISIALGVGCISLPLRTSSGSPKWARSLASDLLSDGCEVSRISAARVRLRSRSATLSIRKSRSRKSVFQFVIMIIPFSVWLNRSWHG
jgi:hypothetical protein